jgi:ecotin
MKRVIPCLLLAMTAVHSDELKPYPPAEEGMTRHVLQLEKRDQEQDAKVEIIVGKTVMTDGVNRHFFGGKLEQRTIEGWGYTYHILPVLGPMAGTLMGVPGGKEPVETFVQVGGDPYLVRYNSKLPLVVYVPEGCEVRYRIWSAPAETQKIPEG